MIKNEFIKITIMFLLSSNFIFAQQNVKDEIIERCKKQMGNYGSSMVKACVDQDLEAEEALKNY